MPSVRETLSEFVQRPTKVIARLSEGDVLLARRDGDDLVLRRAEDARRDEEIVERLALVFDGLLADGDRGTRQLERAFPWVAFLPADDATEFARNFSRTLRATASIGNFSQLRILLNAWEDTAAILADPARLADARRDTHSGDLIPASDHRG